MAHLGAREAKLAQYLNEALGMEKELETALAAHVSMTTRAPYKRRLQEHLRETKRHARDVERRLKRIGGEVQSLPLPEVVPDPVVKGVSAAAGLATRAVAAAKGPLHLIRGGSDEERMLKNAKTEYWQEHREIATYAALEQLAQGLGDAETAKLARAIRREEERMAGFLARQIPTLTRAVGKAEVPAAERPPASKGSPASPAASARSRAAKTARSAPGSPAR
ncbi:MAG: DUF892 family protein [Solirubrobacteraceae bacterium]